MPTAERRPGRKLTEADVLEIRRQYAAGGVTLHELGQCYGVHLSTICRVAKGNRWGHLPVQPEASTDRRTASGEQSSNHKLTEESVQAIRYAYADGGVSLRTLADQHGVSESTVSRVVNGRRWRHVTT